MSLEIIDIRGVGGSPGVLHLVIYACERDFQIHENFHLVKFSNHSILTKRKFASQFFLSNVSKTLFW